MPGLVITVAQRKGGAGKTTLAAQLAVAWAQSGAQVAVLDIDPQGSLAAWVELRRARLGANAVGFAFAALPGWRAASWIEDQARRADLVLIDGPPHADAEAQIAVRAAGLVLVPVQPSPLDLWATETTLKMARDERRRPLVVEPGSFALGLDGSNGCRPGRQRTRRGDPDRQPRCSRASDVIGSRRRRERRREPCRCGDRRARGRDTQHLELVSKGD
jgi:hypothetical protein